MSKGNTYFTRKYIIKYLSDHHCYCCYHGNRITDDMILYDLTDKEVLELVNIVTGNTFNEESWFKVNKSFIKSDLKNHMVVRLRDGRVGVIFGNYIITASSMIFKDHYNDDLTMSCSKDMDIVQVFDHLDYSSVLDDSVLIWDRQDEEEIKEVTIAEVEEKFGCKVKIINDKNT
jgi:hypothetical protein